MFSLFPTTSHRARLNRRDAMKAATLSSMYAPLPFLQAATASSQQTHSATAKRCIYIFLCGGPSQLDMWDLKPDAPDSIRGPFHPISTSVPGLQIGDLLPLTAQRADKLAIIRSMMHTSTSLKGRFSRRLESFLASVHDEEEERQKP